MQCLVWSAKLVHGGERTRREHWPSPFPTFISPDLPGTRQPRTSSIRNLVKQLSFYRLKYTPAVYPGARPALRLTRHPPGPAAAAACARATQPATARAPPHPHAARRRRRPQPPCWRWPGAGAPHPSMPRRHLRGTRGAEGELPYSASERVPQPSAEAPPAG